MIHPYADFPPARRLAVILGGPAVRLAHADTAEYVRRFLDRMVHLPAPTGLSVAEDGAVRMEWETRERRFSAFILGDALHMVCAATEAGNSTPFCPTDNPLVDCQQGI